MVVEAVVIAEVELREANKVTTKAFKEEYLDSIQWDRVGTSHPMQTKQSGKLKEVQI